MKEKLQKNIVNLQCQLLFVTKVIYLSLAYSKYKTYTTTSQHIQVH